MNVIIDYQTFKSYFNFDNPDPHFYYGFSYYKPFDSLSISSIIDVRFIKSKTTIYYYQIIQHTEDSWYYFIPFETIKNLTEEQFNNIIKNNFIYNPIFKKILIENKIKTLEKDFE